MRVILKYCATNFLIYLKQKPASPDSPPPIHTLACSSAHFIKNEYTSITYNTSLSLSLSQHFINGLHKSLSLLNVITNQTQLHSTKCLFKFQILNHRLIHLGLLLISVWLLRNIYDIWFLWLFSMVDPLKWSEFWIFFNSILINASSFFCVLGLNLMFLTV